MIVGFPSMMRPAVFSFLLFFIPCSLFAQENGSDIEIYAGGIKYPSWEAYRFSASGVDSLVKTSLGAGGSFEKVAEKGGPVFPQGSSFSGRVAGIEPSFEDIWQGLYAEPLTVHKVSSPEEIRRDLQMRLGKEEPVILIVSDRKKARIMGLRKGIPQREPLLINSAAQEASR